MKKSKRQKASKREDGVDLMSNMPDHILVLILSRLPSTEEVIRTSILSTKWRYLWTSVPSVKLIYPAVTIDRKNELRKNRFQEFVDWVLGNRSVDLDCCTLRCSDYYSMSTVGRWIHMAIKNNVKQLDLRFDPLQDYKELDEEYEIPHCLVTCCSLQVLTLCLFECGRLRLPKIIGLFPAVRVLKLCCLDLLDNEDLVKDFFKSCPSLEDLSLNGCSMKRLELLCISCPKLKKLRIKNYKDVKLCDGVKISCPKLVFLELKGYTADNFFFESLDFFKEAVIEPEGLESASVADLIGNRISVLIPRISHVESLRINLRFFCQYFSAAHDPALPNLKTLVLTTTSDAFTMDELTRVLHYYLKLGSFKLIIKEEICLWEHFKLDDVEKRNSRNPDLKRVEFLNFFGEKPKLVLDRCSRDGFEFMEMVFSCANKANGSQYRSLR